MVHSPSFFARVCYLLYVVGLPGNKILLTAYMYTLSQAILYEYEMKPQ